MTPDERNLFARNLMARALTAYQERVMIFCTQYAEANRLTFDDVANGPYWEACTQQEAALLADGGPETYLRYVDENDWIDHTSIAAELDHTIMRLLREDPPPPD